MCTLNFSSKLWGLFKALISGALSEMVELCDNDKKHIMGSINQTVVNYFTQVMQMDSFTLRQEAFLDDDYP